MDKSSHSKADRMLEIYCKLVHGETLNKSSLAAQYHVSERSIQRDIEDLKCFIEEHSYGQDICYDYRLRGYQLINLTPTHLSNNEILAVCKILLESRSMRKDEMIPLLDKLVDCAVPKENQKLVSALIANEKIHYIEPHHNKKILDILWDLGRAVREQRIIEIEYERIKDPQSVRRRLQPVGLMFSEYYFYLTAFLEDKTNFEVPDDLFPTIYRVDRIRECNILNEHFQIPYAKRFEEGEFRKRVQFMYGGRLRQTVFLYRGPSPEAVLDRLPTAVVLRRDENGWLIRAEVFGKGIEMWLRSQGDMVQMVSPLEQNNAEKEIENEKAF